MMKSQVSIPKMVKTEIKQWILLCPVLMCTAISCENNNEPIDREQQLFDLISIEYTVNKIVPVEMYVTNAIYNNQTSEMITAHCPVDAEIPFSSFFVLDPLYALENTNLSELEVLLPRIGDDGILDGYSTQYHPLFFNTKITWCKTMLYSFKTEVPKYSIYKLNIDNVGYHVDATFRCKVKSEKTGAISELSGDWSGTQFLRQRGVVTDDQDKQIITNNKFILY